MRITPTGPMKHVEQIERMTAFLFGMAQVALVFALFWALKAYIVNHQ